MEWLINDVVRQLRHRADDACPGWADGKHTYDRASGCRQVQKAGLGALYLRRRRHPRQCVNPEKLKPALNFGESDARTD